VRRSPQDFRRHGAGVRGYIDSGTGDCVGYWNQEKRSWALRGRNPTRDVLVAGAPRCSRPLAELLRQRLLIEKTVGHLRHASENPATQAAPACAVARKFGEAQIFGGTHTNLGWTDESETILVLNGRR
jgi:hypothetical protein